MSVATPTQHRPNSRQRKPKRFFPRHLSLFLTALLLTGLLLGATAAQSDSHDQQFRIGFSSRVFTEVNDNDALAAIKIWAKTITQEQNFAVSPNPQVLKNVDQIRQALSQHEIDALTLPLDEYWVMREFLDQQIVIVSDYDEDFTQEYLLLVHKDSAIQELTDLRDRKVNFMQDSQTSLAPIWMETILLQAGFPPLAEFCQASHITNLQKALLPVFFRQADACVVTRNSFNVMSELNPQISQNLKVLLVSPKLVATVFTFRQGYDNPVREKIIKESTQIIRSPAGEQVLKLFKTGMFRAEPVSCLDSSFALLSTHKQLLDQNRP